MALHSLKNIDYSDRELLHILHDLAGTEWATTDDLADQIRITPPSRNGSSKKMTDGEKRLYAKRCIATRYSWMRRFGWVERDEHRTKWRVTDIGRDLMNGRLTKSLATSLDKLSTADRVLVMRSLTDAYRTDRIEGQTFIRREWTHGARVRA